MANREMAPHVVVVSAPFLLALASSLWGLALANDASAEDHPDASHIERLIDGLVSRNAEPSLVFVDKGVKAVFPEGFDHRDRLRVDGVIDQLVKMGEHAFPQLIQHVDDERYSYTSRWMGESHVNYSVGSVCFRVVRVQVELYCAYTRNDPRTDRQLRWLVRKGNESTQALEAWWRKHNKKSLREMQLEATEWALAFERKRGFHNDEARRSIVVPLERLIDRLKNSHQPIRVDRKGWFLGDDAKFDWRQQEGK
jgi:hypothetical protein